ncbi:MAG TPA: sulfatase-like hydrolase/transferase [Burkholderiales bacterium]|nr:sulfatase-like hydrolase/transferase [Burkholderiales bacterium]
MHWRSTFARVFLDLALWFATPVVFLFYYYNRSLHGAPEAILPHLRLVLFAWLGVALLRLAAATFLKPPPIARAVSALLVATAIATMLVYYTLVIIGLESWGRVISWDLIRSYAGQATALADALGVPMYAAAGALVAAYLIVFATAWLLGSRLGWITQTARSAAPRLVNLIMVAGAIVCAVEIYQFLAFPPLHQKEPLSLTFFPTGAVHLLQTVAIDPMRADRLDAVEDTARAAYRSAGSVIGRNVVLIVVDALRADRMSVYGYSRRTTPNLDRIAAAGLVRVPAEMRSTCSASACGLLSLLTSKYVHEFSARPFSLHEVLRLHRYRIHMILGGDHSNFYGLRQFYGHVDHYFDGSVRRGAYMNDDRIVLEKAAELPPWDGTPVMIQFHLMSTHVLGKRYEEHSPFRPSATYAIPANRRAPLVDNFYDNGVVQSDTMIGALLEILRGKSYLRDALVVITADHGESLGEGGRYAHAQSVTEEALRIPLLLIAYGYQPAAVWRGDVVASQVDVAPTILVELGISAPPTWSGVGLQEKHGRAYTYFQEASAAGLVDHRDPSRRWKYWVDTKHGQEYAYDLTADARETVNVIAEVPEALKRAWRLEYLRFQAGGVGLEKAVPQ